MGKSAAVATFLNNKDFYHPICSKMIATDLCVADTAKTTSTSTFRYVLGAAALASIGFLFVRVNNRK
jgi:hypothetical protein